MTVSFSCRCPNADYLGFETSPEAIIRTTMKAEELGFDAVFVNNHIIVDSSPRSAPWMNTYDPFVALSFMAANTKHIDLGVLVLIVPYRNPIATAKASPAARTWCHWRQRRSEFCQRCLARPADTCSPRRATRRSAGSAKRSAGLIMR